MYMINYKNRNIGVYNNYFDAETFILGCLQNNLMTKHADILTFKKNSCYCTKISTITLESITNNVESNEVEKNNVELNINKVETTEENICFNNDNNKVIMEMAKQKIELQHKINMLKIQKEKIEESKRVYESDIKLFELFDNSKTQNQDFEIPELFIEKYKLIKKLKENDSLSWENFVKDYNCDFYNDYNDYFGTNTYEELFITKENETDDSDNLNKPTNFSEEFDIESDSNTETTEDDSNLKLTT